MITFQQLITIMPNARRKAEAFLPALNAAMDEFSIDTDIRRAAFLAQIGHESAQLLYTAEIASGAAYEGRKDLGNNLPGDGKRYKGRGLIQITGKANYVKMMMAMDIDCLDHPEIIEAPELACRSAAWWWQDNGCNEIADTGDFIKLTKRINGGTNGLADRQALYARAKSALGVE